MSAPATQQMNVTVAMRVSKDVHVSATFSLFVEDETDAEDAGALSARLFSAYMTGYGSNAA